MDVIAKISSGRFLCEVTDYEIRRYMHEFGNGDDMQVGQKIDLTEGFHFAEKAVSAMRETNSFIQANKNIVEAVIKGIQVAGKLEDDNS